MFLLHIAKVFAFLIAVTGFALALNKGLFYRIIEFVKKGNRAYYAGVLRIILGALYLFVAHMSRREAPVLLFGIIFLVSGISIFFIKRDDLFRMIENIRTAPANTVKLIKLIPVFIGILLLCTL